MMKVKLKKVTVRDLSCGYMNSNEEGVVGYNGKLDIRPAYQREFVYKDKQRTAVIETVVKGYPLNTMFWAKNNGNTYEILDGQQRTISLCQYINGEFSVDHLYFHNLEESEQNTILDYELMVYTCDGDAREKLEWFKVINVPGLKLTNQELKNASFTGPWLSDLKRYFSRTGCPASDIGAGYITGSPIRQEFLETAIDWISNDNIADYMSEHQHDPSAAALWIYFQSVISWVGATFTNKRKSMKSVNWGALYNTYKDNMYDPIKIEEQCARLVADDNVTKKSGIYPYVLTGDQKYLSIRAFSDSMKQKVYEFQNGICLTCKVHFEIPEMEGDHITPWVEGGKTNEENLQMLCRNCNRRKSSN